MISDAPSGASDKDKRAQPLRRIAKLCGRACARCVRFHLHRHSAHHLGHGIRCAWVRKHEQPHADTPPPPHAAKKPGAPSTCARMKRKSRTCTLMRNDAILPAGGPGRAANHCELEAECAQAGRQPKSIETLLRARRPLPHINCHARA